MRATWSPLLLLILAAASLTPAAAQDKPAPTLIGPTLAQIDADIELVTNDTELGETARNKALDALKSARGFTEQANATAAEATELDGRLKSAPQQIEEIRRKLAEPLADPPDVAAIADRPLSEIDASLRNTETELRTARQDLTAREQELATMRAEQGTLRDRLTATRAKLDEIQAALAAEPAPGESEPVVSAQRTLLRARRAFRTAEANLITLKQSGFESLTALITARRDLAAKQVRQLEPAAEVYRTAAARAKLRETARGLAAAEQLAEQLNDAPPVVAKAARKNVDLARQLQELQSTITQSAATAAAARANLDTLRREFDSIQNRLDQLDVDAEVGAFLRRRSASLPKIAPRKEVSAQRRSQLGRTGAAQLDIDDLRRAVPDLEVEFAAALPNGSGATDEQRRIAELARQVLVDRRDLLEKLHAGYGEQVQNLGDTIASNQDIRELAGDYAAFIGERLFWIRSEPPLELSDAGRVVHGLGVVLDPSAWLNVFRDIGSTAMASPITWFPGVIAAVLLVGYRRRAHRALRAIAADVGKVRSDSFKLTLRAMLLTVAMSGGVPLLLAVIGLHLLRGAVAPFSAAVGAGLVIDGLVLLFLGFLRNLCIGDGVGSAHFRWPESGRRPFRRALIWLMCVAVASGFCVGFTIQLEDEELRRGVGRIAFTVGMLTLAGVFGWLLRPTGPIMSIVASRSPQGWVHRTRYLWYPVGVIAFVSLAAMTLLGYYFTAHQMMIRVRYTLWLATTAVVLNQLLIRWLNVTHRRLAFLEAVRKREAQRAEQAAKDAADAADRPSGSEATVSESDVPLAQINEQTRAMLRTLMGLGMLVGLYLIWADVLPALNLLNDIHLWTYQSTVDGVTTSLPITLIDAVAAALWITLAVIGARNLPGVLELLVLNRLPIDAGARYAVTSVSRYIITAVGIVLAFSAVGVGWTDVQWLVAALSIGLGFGLQEIIANFVSGLILLFERPIRVGDVITIGDTTGSVSKIRIRATTIVNWERKELVVPNKEFITGRLLNWTLTDAVNRIVIAVGIAYGSDTRRAYQLLLEAAREHPDVLDEPEPRANFDAFGDNSLNFVLRVYLNSMENRLKVIHEMHTAIDDKFREAGIEIAFPQRDVHLDTGGQPLELRWADGSFTPPTSSPNA